MEIMLIRHAESEGNRLAIMQGDGEDPLSETGKKQITIVKTLLPKVDFVVSSDLSRSSNTAFRLTGRLDLIDPRLRERGAGKWIGIARAEFESLFPGSLENDDLRPSDFETEESLRSRVYPVLLELAGRPEAFGVVVGHGAVMRWLIKDLTGIPYRFKNLAGMLLKLDNNRLHICGQIDLLAVEGERLK